MRCIQRGVERADEQHWRDGVIDLREPCHVCVIGSGAAGLVVAAELVRQGTSVTLLDSGNVLHRCQSSAASALTGDPIIGLIDPEDLAERSWVAGSGWPLDFAELEPWLRRPNERFGIGATADAPPPSARSQVLGEDFWDDFDAKRFRSGLSDEFGSRLVDELRASALCRIKTNTRVVELMRADDGGGITSVRCQGNTGETTVEAATFVLACGAIENARLLLASDRGNGGIGNEYGNVGRYFMDHPLFEIGHIEADAGVAHGYAATSATLSEELEAIRIAISISPCPSERHLTATNTFRRLLRNPQKLLRSPATIAREDGHLRRATSGFVVSRRWLGVTRLDVAVQCEQPPLIDSQVSLSYDNDAHGSPLARVEWHIGEQVRTSVLAVQRRLAEHIGRVGLGTYVPRAGSLDELGVPSSMAHHMGTTRMSRHPKDGVVTPNGRVHSVPNLFIAGSSVFPTSGSMNPMLTLIGLAGRLADHLASETANTTSISRQPEALSD